MQKRLDFSMKKKKKEKKLKMTLKGKHNTQTPIVKDIVTRPITLRYRNYSKQYRNP